MSDDAMHNALFEELKQNCTPRPRKGLFTLQPTPDARAGISINTQPVEQYAMAADLADAKETIAVLRSIISEMRIEEDMQQAKYDALADQYDAITKAYNSLLRESDEAKQESEQ